MITKKKKKAAPKKRTTAPRAQMVALKANIPLVLHSKIGAVIKEDLLMAANKKIKGFGDRYIAIVEGTMNGPYNHTEISVMFDTKADAQGFARAICKTHSHMLIGGKYYSFNAVRIEFKNVIDGRTKEIKRIEK